jgi:pyruvate,orthophosphate dikinase
MFRLGLPVPPGYIISTENCLEFFAQEKIEDNTLPQELIDQYTKAIHEIETQTGNKFGVPKTPSTPYTPLLLSVRSGAAVSMPGMMDTILNLGINDEIVQSLARVSNNPRFAFDTYRRFLQMFGTVVLNVDKNEYENVMHAARKRKGFFFF